MLSDQVRVELAGTLHNLTCLMKCAYTGDSDALIERARDLGVRVRAIDRPTSAEEWSQSAKSCDVLLVTDADVGSEAFSAADLAAARTFGQVVVYLGESTQRLDLIRSRASAPSTVVVQVAGADTGIRVAASIREVWLQLEAKTGYASPVGDRTRWLVQASAADFVVSVCDAHGTFLYVNRQFEELTGLASAEVVGSSVLTFAARVQDRRRFAQMWQAISSGRVWRGRLSNVRPDGSVYWVDLTVIPELGQSGSPHRYFAIYGDVTEAVRGEAELRAAKEAADSANAAKSDFLSSMSHELRTPLNAVIGFGQLLREDRMIKGSTRLSMFVEQICSGGEHLLQLISQVLDLARLEAGRVAISMEQVDVDRVVNECVNLVKGVANKQGVMVYVHAFSDSDDEVYAHADFTRLKQVLLNLLSNAVKYNCQGGQVLVDYGCSGDEVTIAVQDTGIGVRLEDRDRLFTPFERLGQAGGNIEGSGLGLALSKRLIEAMGGKLTYAPVEEAGPVGSAMSGSRFVVSVRKAKPRPVDFGAVSQLTELDGYADPKHLLYIEDNPSNTLLMRNLLDVFENVELDCASTAEIGLAMTEVRCPDAIIMDLNLPGMNGFEALKKLRANDATRHVPVLCLTADVMRLKKDSSESFDEFMTKPVRIKELRRALERMLKTGLKPRSEGVGPRTYLDRLRSFGDE